MRRAFMFGVVLFSAACVSYVLGAGLKHRVAETVVEMAFGTITLVTACYVFGAAWQDVSVIRSNRRGQRDYYHRDDGDEDDRVYDYPRIPPRGRVDTPDEENG